MSFFRLCETDAKYGFRYNRLRYLAVCCVFLLGLLWMRKELLEGSCYGILHGDATYTDAVLYLLRGMKRLYAEPYRLPLMWLINQALLLSLTGGYPYSTDLIYRQQILLHHKKKTDWWYSKCLWCVGTVASFYLLCYVVAAVWCFLFHMPFQTAFSAEYAKIWYEVNMENVTGSELWLILTVLPFAISTAMALLQLFLGLAFGSQLAFLLLMGVQAASTVLCLPLLPGNYSMILRSTIIDANGVKTEWGLCLAAGIAFLSTLLGGAYIRKRDIL